MGSGRESVAQPAPSQAKLAMSPLAARRRVVPGGVVEDSWQRPHRNWQRHAECMVAALGTRAGADGRHDLSGRLSSATRRMRAWGPPLTVERAGEITDTAWAVGEQKSRASSGAASSCAQRPRTAHPATTRARQLFSPQGLEPRGQLSLTHLGFERGRRVPLCCAATVPLALAGTEWCALAAPERCRSVGVEGGGGQASVIQPHQCVHTHASLVSR